MPRVCYSPSVRSLFSSNENSVVRDLKQVDWGSNLIRVIKKTLKMVLVATSPNEVELVGLVGQVSV